MIFVLFENIDFKLLIFHMGKLRPKMKNEFPIENSGRAQAAWLQRPSLDFSLTRLRVHFILKHLYWPDTVPRNHI
jgi:hypothetical protein